MDVRLFGSMNSYYNHPAEISKQQGMAAEKSEKSVKMEKESTKSNCDTFTLTYQDVLTAQKGYIEMNGGKIAVTEEMADNIQNVYDRTAAYNETVSTHNLMLHNTQVAQQQSEAVAEAAKKEMQILEIFRRLSKGGEVPPQDEQALMEYSSEMYMSAKMMAMAVQNHEKYDSVFEEEETEQSDNTEIEDMAYHQVEISVSGGDIPQIESVSETSVEVE